LKLTAGKIGTLKFRQSEICTFQMSFSQQVPERDVDSILPVEQFGQFW
jgi:hypothetical protein